MTFNRDSSMKTIACSAIWLVILLFFASCEKETILSVDQSSVEISDAGGSQTVSLTANKPWSASSNQSWCKVSPSTGEEATNSRITITCDPNTSYDARNCTVTFTCAELTKNISVSQATNNGLLVSQTEYNITNAAQQLEIKVQANVKFSVDVDNGCKDWVKYNTTKGLTASTVVLDIAKNETYDNREGKVTIKQDGGNLSSSVVIKQGQTNGLFLTTSGYNLSNEKHTLTVEVKSNIEFEVKSEADWIKYVETKGLKTNQIILDVDANETFDTREGTVIVKQKNGDLTGTITVRQDQNYGILVTQSEYNLTNEAQTIDIEVKYNVEFDVIIPEECKDWISFVSTKSLDTRTYTFSIAKNETYDDREGSITFKQKDGPASETISIIQDQQDYLSAEKDEYVVTNDAQILSIEVKSNINYDVDIDELSKSWISLAETKALSKSTVVIQIAQNEGDYRTGGITLKGNKEVFRIRIDQEGSNPVIIYTTTDGLPVRPNSAEGIISDKLEILSNTYENGIGKLVLRDTVTTIPKRSFAYCSTLESIRIPESVITIGDYAFLSCTNLREIVLPRSLATIRNGSFVDCKSLETIDLPQALTTLGRFSFLNCEKLQTIIIPEGIITIGSGLAAGCTNLREVSIPITVSEIESQAFQECINLKSIVIPASVERIQTEAFWGCSNLEEVFLNEGLRTIDGSVFKNCISLHQITIPGSITSLGFEVFMGCTGLISATICDGVQDLGDSLFEDCTSLVDVSLPNSVTRMYRTFPGCISLREIRVPENVTTVYSAFRETSLERIILPSNCSDVNNAFINCSKLIEVDLPEGIEEIVSTFVGCSSLTRITLPSSVNYIYQAFDGCSSLLSINLSNSLTRIGYRSFNSCSSLEKITIPSSVQIMCEHELFLGCDQLKEVEMLPSIPPVLDDQPSTAHHYMFSHWMTISIPKGSLEAYLSAPGWSSFYESSYGTLVERDM